MALAVGTTEIPQELWQSALESLERSMPESMYHSFLKQLRPISLQSNTLSLAVPSIVSLHWIEDRLRPQVTALLSEVFGERLELHFVLIEAPQQTAAHRLPRTAAAFQQRLPSFA